LVASAGITTRSEYSRLRDGFSPEKDRGEEDSFARGTLR
jgi:hypothetical protein